MIRKAAVTGASGFCGRAMLAHLEGRGISTLPIGRRQFYRDGERMPAAAAVLEALADFQPDVVFHFAGLSHSKQPLALFESNFFAAFALLSALEDVERRPVVVLCGSAAEYGRISHAMLPVREEQPENPADDYGASKLAQTMLGRSFAQRGFRIVLSRPFNIIGAGMPQSLALGSFMRQIAESLPQGVCHLKVGNLSPSRDFVTIDDAVRAWFELAITPAAWGRLVNICSGTGVTIASLVDGLVRAAPVDVQVEPDAALVRPADIPEHYGDNTRLRELLQWAPASPGETAIASMLRQHLENSLKS